MVRHLAAMVESANTVKDYGAPGTGFRLIRGPSGKLAYVAARIAIANVMIGVTVAASAAPFQSRGF
jgi:hypothetical protein